MLAVGRPTGVTQTPHASFWIPVKREPLFNIPPVIVAMLAVLALVHAVRTYVLSDEQDIEFLLTFAFIPARYDTSIVLGGVLPGGFGARDLDLRHLCADPRRLDAFRRQCGVAAAVRQRGGAPLRHGALPGVLRRDGGGRRGDASGHPCRRDRAGDRRVGVDFGHHGGGDAFCVPARRAAQLLARRRRHRPIACRRSRSPACCAIRACSSSWRCGSASIFCSGSARCRCRASARIRRSPGRRISAAFSPACFCFPGSIRPPPEPHGRRHWCNAAIIGCNAALSNVIAQRPVAP